MATPKPSGEYSLNACFYSPVMSRPIWAPTLLSRWKSLPFVEQQEQGKKSRFCAPSFPFYSARPVGCHFVCLCTSVFDELLMLNPYGSFPLQRGGSGSPQQDAALPRFLARAAILGSRSPTFPVCEVTL